MSLSSGAPWRHALLLGAALCALLSIVGPWLAPDQAGVMHWSQPLTTGLLLLVVVTTADAPSRVYRALVGLGLIASLAADTLRIQPSDPLLASLAVSMLAYLAFFAAFVVHAFPLRHKSAVVGYAAVATVVLALALPLIGGPLRSTLIAHVIVLALTASQAASWMLEDLASRSARLAAFGMSCLVASNAVLVLDRFVYIVPVRDLWVLVPYWIALGSLARSVERPPPPALHL